MTNLDSAAIADRNKANYLKAKDAFNRNEIDLCVSFYSPDHQIMSQPSPKGRAAIRAFFEKSHQTWPDIKIVVAHAVAEGNWVMGRSVTTATHTKDVMAVMPTDKQIETTFWDLHRFDDVQEARKRPVRSVKSACIYAYADAGNLLLRYDRLMFYGAKCEHK